MSILEYDAYPKISHLSNGLRVATIPIKSKLSTIGLWVKSGSIYEDKDTNGVAHYLEHIIFRGNQKYPKDSLEKIAEQKAINLMAHTSRTSTAFFAQVDQHNIAQTTDIISQIVLNPDIADQAVETEREVILTEEYEVSLDFNEVLFDKLHEAAFSSSIGFPILGSNHNIKSITAKQIKDHHSKFFNPHNCCFVAATNVPHDKIVELVEAATKFIKPRPPIDMKAEDTKVCPVFQPKPLMFGSNFVNESWVGLAIEGPSLNSPYFIPANILKFGIGNVDPGNPFEASPYMSLPHISRFSANVFPYADSGVIAFLANTQFGYEGFLSQAVVQAITLLTTQATPDVLAMSKLRFMNHLAKALSSSRAIADELGNTIVLGGHWRSMGDWEGEIGRINPQTMGELAARYFSNKQFAAAFITDIEKQRTAAEAIRAAQEAAARKTAPIINPTGAPQAPKEKPRIINPNDPTGGARTSRILRP